MGNNSLLPSSLLSNSYSALNPNHIPPITPSPLAACAYALEAIVDQKGIDPVWYDVRKITDMTDYLLIVTGTSDRHIKGIADNVQKVLALHGEEPSHATSRKASNWIVLDYGDFVIHVFHEESRLFYNLDERWKAGTAMPFPEKIEERAKRLRTGMFLPRRAPAPVEAR